MFIKSYDFKAAIRASLPSCTDSGFFMGERKVNKKIILKGFGYSLMTISGFFSLSALGLHGLSKVGGFVGVAGFKYGEAAFATEAAEEFAQENYHKGLGYLGLCVLLFIISVSAATIYLFGEDKKDLVQYQEAKKFLQTKEKDVIDAKAQRAACNPSHVTKCVKPLSELVTQKEAERDQAAKQLSKFTDAEGVNQTWKDLSVWAGFQGENDANDLHIERNVIIAALWDFIAMMFIVMSEKKDKQPKDEVKKTTSGRRDDDFFEPDYKQPERTFNREPVKFSEPVNEQSVNDFIEDAYKQNLMKTIDLKTDVLVCSPVKGSGKSAIAALFARLCKQANHRVIVIDINFKRNAENTLGWYLDDNIEVVGAKGNYREITSFFNGIKKEIADRHNRDDMNYPQITIVIDEMVSLVDHIDSEILSSFLKTVLSNGRQLKLNLMICTHADTIEGTGLKGITALKDGMACELMPFFEFDNNGDKVYLVRKTSTFVTVSSKKPIKKSEIYYHPGVITANWRELDREPDFKQTLKNIVTPNAQNLKKLNGDIFPA